MSMASLILSSNRTGIRLVDLKDFEISLFILYPPENYVDGSTLATFEEADVRDTVDKTGPRKQLLNKLRIWFSSNFGIDLSHEIYALDMLGALKSLLKHCCKHILRSLRLYGDQALTKLVFRVVKHWDPY